MKEVFETNLPYPDPQEFYMADGGGGGGLEQGPEPRHAVEFREYLIREFGITDPDILDKHMDIFRQSVLDTARKYGILPKQDSIETPPAE